MFSLRGNVQGRDRLEMMGEWGVWLFKERCHVWSLGQRWPTQIHFEKEIINRSLMF